PLSAQPVPERPEDPARVSLDAQRIARRLAETREVSCLLTEVFTEEQEKATKVTEDRREQRKDSSDRVPEVQPDEIQPDEAQPDEIQLDEVRPGLDRAHTRLLRDLATGPFWPHEKFKTLCDRNGVLPQGAVDVVNEAALDAAGEILLEEEVVSIAPGTDAEAENHLLPPDDLTDDTMGDRTTRTSETKVSGWRVDRDVLRDMLG
ncbi:MAG: hypothetical protein QG608_416, partial [Actinomycetota bacterium]|nr:hypothetical protein [Actinomycetota bacterium]